MDLKDKPATYVNSSLSQAPQRHATLDNCLKLKIFVIMIDHSPLLTIFVVIIIIIIIIIIRTRL